jgi:hypothetical protein
MKRQQKGMCSSGKMPALQTLVAHGGVSRAGKMPALQTLVAHGGVSRAGQDAGAPDE